MDQARTAGAVPNFETGYYELNTLTDITEQQMRRIIYHAIDGDSYTYAYCGAGAIRTNLIRNPRSWAYAVTASRFLFGLNDIEVAAFPDFHLNVSGSEYFIYECPKLRKVMGIVMLDNQSLQDHRIDGCPRLESIRIKGAARSVNLRTLQAIDIESLTYLMGNKFSASEAMTLTVHPAVNAKINDEANEEWHQLLYIAEEKNVTIATTE